MTRNDPRGAARRGSTGFGADIGYDAANGAPRCTHWVEAPANSPYRFIRCDLPATHQFLLNGIPYPHAGYTCQAHGEQVIAEYDPLIDIVGVWTLEALPNDPLGAVPGHCIECDMEPQL